MLAKNILQSFQNTKENIFALFSPLFYLFKFVSPVISLIHFSLKAINSLHSPWKPSRAIYNIYGISQYFYRNIESPQRIALKPQTLWLIV